MASPTVRLHSVIVDIEPSPRELLRRLDTAAPHVLVGTEPGITFVADEPIAQASELDPEPELAWAATLDPELRVPRWIGLLPYEGERHLERATTPDLRPLPELCEPRWLRFGAVARIEKDVRVVGDDAEAVRNLARRLSRPRAKAAPAARAKLELSRPIEAEALHISRIRRALAHIDRGDIYQVNLARRFELAVQGDVSELFSLLAPAELPACPLAFGDARLRVVALSPELFLRAEPGRQLMTSPIKGTRPRAFDAARDAELTRALDDSPKERAELAMILDVERNDLGRVAVAGSVELARAPHVEPHGPVLHRLATLTARAREGVTRTQLLKAMLPSGSVTGAPKVRAMQLIAELEAARRGLYTGAFGFLRHDGGLELAMAIRVLVAEGERGHYFSGGGIVADSDPEQEVQETLWKARRLLEIAEN